MRGFGSRLGRLCARYGATFVSFGAMQAMQFLVPLAALPWLGRVLGKDAFGLLMYMCLLPPLVALLMDFGGTAAGSRAASRIRGQTRNNARLLGSALSAKIILGLICLALGLLLWPVLPHAAEHSLAYWLAIAAGAARGLSPVWFYQGAARDVPLLALWDISASLLALALVFLFIHEPWQWPMYLFFLALCRLVANARLTLRLWLQYHPKINMEAGLGFLRSSAALAGSAAAITFCQNGGQIALGFFLPAEAMGILVAVNKMLRSLVAMLNPVTQTIFPEICIKAGTDSKNALRMLGWALTASTGCALVCAAFVWLAAPWLIQLALGPGYDVAVSVLRVTILAAPLMACDLALAGQALTPFGLEKKMAAWQTVCAALCLPLAAILAMNWGMAGGAWLPVCMETLLLAGTGAIALRWLPRVVR